MRNKTTNCAASLGLLLSLLLCAAGCGHKGAEAPTNAAAPGGASALPPQARSQMEAQQRSDAATRAAAAQQQAKHP